MASDNLSKAMEHFAQGIALMAQAGMANSPAVTINPAALNTDDAARYIGVSRSRFYEIKDEGLIKPVKHSKPPVYKTRALDAYLDKLEKD